MHSESTLKIALGLGPLGIGALLGVGAALGAGIVPTTTPLWIDLLLAGGAAASIGSAALLGTALRSVTSLPLQIAPVVSRGRSGGQPIYRFRAQLGRGRALTQPVAAVTWRPEAGPDVELVPWLPGKSLCGPFTFLARDPGHRVQGDGHFMVRLQVRSDGRAWSAERRISTGEVTEGPFEGVTLDRRGVRFTEDWQRVTPPLEGRSVER